MGQQATHRGYSTSMGCSPPFRLPWALPLAFLLLCRASDPLTRSRGLAPYPYGASLRRGRRIYQEDDYRAACFAVNNSEVVKSPTSLAPTPHRQRYSRWIVRAADARRRNILGYSMGTPPLPLISRCDIPVPICLISPDPSCSHRDSLGRVPPPS